MRREMALGSSPPVNVRKDSSSGARRVWGADTAPSRVLLALAVAITVGMLLAGLSPVLFAPSSTPGTSPAASTQLAAAAASLASGAGPAGGQPTACATTGSGSAACSPTSTSAIPAVLPIVNTTGGRWVPVNYSRAYTSLAYDARNGYVLAFGGLGPTGPLGDTWKYQHGNWTILLTATAPSPRWGAAMTYDDSIASVVLFGGENGTTYFNDTWEFEGGIWTNVTTAHSPSPRAFAGLAFDANTSDNYTVLFGGNDASTVFGDTWVFHGQNHTWSQLAPIAAPAAVTGASFVFDRHIGYAVLFGGLLPNGTYSSATWEYLNGVWTQPVELISPPARAFAGMTYDRASNVLALVLFGGNSSLGYLGDTWEFVGQSWVEISPGTPGLGARAGASITFDGLHPGDFYTVLWGGFSGTSTFYSDTWNFTGTAWSEVTPGGHPTALSGASLVDLPNAGYTVLFGGLGPLGPTNATWLERGGSWTLLCGACGPSPRYNAAASYDRKLGAVVLFGGTAGGSTYFNDTWEFVAGHWLNVTGGAAPSARDLAAFAYYTTPLNVSVLFGGYNGATYLNDTWEFSAAGWSEVPVAGPHFPPATRADAAMTDDGPDGYMLLFGGYNGGTLFNDTWIFRGVLGEWFPLTPVQHPSARYGARMVFDPYNGYVVFTGGANHTALFNDTWEFRGGNWTQFLAPSPPPARSDAAMAFDRADKFLVVFGGSGPGGIPYSDTWLWVAFSAQATATPNPTDVGIPVAFGVSAVAGVEPYTYAWSFGDGQSTPSPTPYHTYTAPGSYNASVTVTDSHAGTPDVTVANVTVVVNPTLLARASASPTVAVQSQPVTFTVTTTGGTPPFTYAWNFGDGAGASVQSPTHAYAAVGTYTASVVVNDSAGNSVSSSIAVDVTTSGLTATVSVLPNVTDVGVPVAFHSVPTGGTAPYTYAWLFGDGQKSSTQNTTHAYATAGTFHVVYWANDSVGQSYSASLSVTVAPPPKVGAFTVSPTSVNVGASASFAVSVSGGTAPYTFVYTGLPAGCSSANVSTLTCVPTSAGTYPVKVTVTDAFAQAANATVTLTVNVSPSPTPGPSPGGGGGGLSTTEQYLLVGLVVVVIAAALIALLLRRRKRGASVKSGTAPPNSPPASPGGGTGKTGGK